MATKNAVVWTGSITVCQLCKGDYYGGIMYDARIPGGGWANMCFDCFRECGCKLGTGYGQKYQAKLVIDGDEGDPLKTVWEKVAG